MRRTFLILVLSALLPALALGQTRHDVKARVIPMKGAVWEFDTMTSPMANAGESKGRLTVKVRINDTVRFEIEEKAPHGVIFENAEIERGTKWKTVPASFILKKLDDVTPAIPAYFDRKKALSTEIKSSGALVEIEILSLKAGESILFACAQHSRGGGAMGKKIMMLGAIALDDEKKSDKVNVEKK